MILQLLAYLGTVTAFVLLTMAIASGLYYLSELVEEYSVFSRKVLSRLIYIVIGILVLLYLVDGFPFKLILLNIVSHWVYRQNLKRFPFITLKSPAFILSCIMVFLNHWLWFRYFSDPSIPPAIILQQRPDYTGRVHPPFSQVASFIGICVWLVPFSLFISLSASDNVLPMSANDSDDGDSASSKAKQRSASLLKIAVAHAWRLIVSLGTKLGYNLDDRSAGEVLA